MKKFFLGAALIVGGGYALYATGYLGGNAAVDHDHDHATFDAWFDKHCETCDRCRKSKANPDIGICEVAFDEMQRQLGHAH